MVHSGSAVPSTYKSRVVNRAVCERHMSARRRGSGARRVPPAAASARLPRDARPRSAAAALCSCRIISNPRSFDFCIKRKPLRDFVNIFSEVNPFRINNILVYLI